MSECEECAYLRIQVDELQNDVLTAWRVRNACLKIAATFVHPGPDGQDYIDRERLVHEWVDQGHDEVAADDAQRQALIREVVQLRALVRDFVDRDPCRFDHHGYCQAHAWFATDPACPHARAKALLGVPVGDEQGGQQ